jgi:hypothetical protein
MEGDNTRKGSAANVMLAASAAAARDRSLADAFARADGMVG